MMLTKSVLIIEDHSTTRRALEFLFRHCGWSVAGASSIAQGIELLGGDPSHIILDLILSDGEGESIIRAVQDSNPLARIIVTTGCTDPSRLASVDRLVPHALLHKPLDFSKILSAVVDRESLTSPANRYEADPRSFQSPDLHGFGNSRALVRDRASRLRMAMPGDESHKDIEHWPK